VNAPQLPELVERVGKEHFAGRYVIGQWAWEVDVVPDYWAQALGTVDEIWTYSTYVADIIAQVASVPVLTMPLPVSRPVEFAPVAPIAPAEGFVFLFTFDYLSTVRRKNPLGLINAFSAAFAPGEGPLLVIKSTNARFRPRERDMLRDAIAERSDIVLADASLAPEELAALYARADCYVSLHRSEGFGLALAEMMVLGKPVIATRFGGNTDFMTHSNSYLVEFERANVGPEGEHYPAQGTWAEPSLEHAAALMREVWHDRDTAAERGARAKADIETQLNPMAVGVIARKRLQRISRLTGERAALAARNELPWPLTELDRMLRWDAGAQRGGLRGFARRAVLRGMRPYTHQQRELNETLASSLRRLSLDVEALREARNRDRDRIAKLEQMLRER
jgi:glycosyltransferase involved in cell wall biosynthesis